MSNKISKNIFKYEVIAYILSFISLVLGILLGINFNPDWLGRFGSIIIVCGASLAASRKIEIDYRKTVSFISNALKEEETNKSINEGFEAGGGSPNKKVPRKIKEKLCDSFMKDIEKVFEEKRKIFKVHELIMVIGGTLINGWGPYGLSFLFPPPPCVTCCL